MLSVELMRLLVLGVRFNLCGHEFALSVYMHPHEGPMLSVRANLPNSRNLGELTPLNIQCPIPYVVLKTPDDFYAWLCYRLERIAVHEANEGLYINGRPYRDPHLETSIA